MLFHPWAINVNINLKECLSDANSKYIYCICAQVKRQWRIFPRPRNEYILLLLFLDSDHVRMRLINQKGVIKLVIWSHDMSNNKFAFQIILDKRFHGNQISVRPSVSLQCLKLCDRRKSYSSIIFYHHKCSLQSRSPWYPWIAVFT